MVMSEPTETPLAVESDERPSLCDVPRARVDDTEMDITPMIDITFLLLIYFVVAAKIGQQDDVALPAARFGVAVAERSAVTITINLDGSGKAIVYLSDGCDETKIVRSADAAEIEKAIAAYAMSEFDPSKATPGNVKQHIIIKAAGNVKHRDVDRAARAAAEGAKELLPQGVRLNFAVLEDAGAKR